MDNTSVLNTQQAQQAIVDSANFWVKVELPEGQSGFTNAKLIVYSNNQVNLLCSRILEHQDGNQQTSKPIPANTPLKLIFHDYSKNVFEIWSAEINQFIAFNNGLDEYSLKNFELVSNESTRRHNRYRIRIPVKLKSIHGKKFLCIFSGCEISEGGVGLWFPHEYKEFIQAAELYEIIFEPIETDSFRFLAECVSPNVEDLFCEGFKAGFRFTDIENKPLGKLRIQQVIEARGHPLISPHNEPEEFKKEHYLAKYWLGGANLF